MAKAMEADDPATIPDPMRRSFRQFADEQGEDRLALAACSRGPRFPIDRAALGIPTGVEPLGPELLQPGTLVDANDAFLAVNRALKAGASVHWLKAPMSANGRNYPAGSFYIEAAGQARAIAEAAAKGLINTQDGDLINRANQARLEAIEVDTFSPEQYFGYIDPSGGFGSELDPGKLAVNS